MGMDVDHESQEFSDLGVMIVQSTPLRLLPLVGVESARLGLGLTARRLVALALFTPARMVMAHKAPLQGPPGAGHGLIRVVWEDGSGDPSVVVPRVVYRWVPWPCHPGYTRPAMVPAAPARWHMQVLRPDKKSAMGSIPALRNSQMALEVNLSWTI